VFSLKTGRFALIVDEHRAVQVAERILGLDLMLSQADLALHSLEADAERRWVRFSSPMLTRSSREQDLEIDLRRALQEDRLTVVYRPIIELASGSMVAVETLGRWTHPIHGPLAPTEFIQIAERIGLMTELTGPSLPPPQAATTPHRWSPPPSR
jgi:predicted signal transduction protein with EAL and GGDEF domain